MLHDCSKALALVGNISAMVSGFQFELRLGFWGWSIEMKEGRSTIAFGTIDVVEEDEVMVE